MSPPAQEQWDTLVDRARREAEPGVAPRQHRWRRPVLAPLASALAGLALALATAWSVAQLLQAPGPTQEELDAGRRALLALVSSSLEEHLRVHGEYPERLDEVLPLQVQVRYRRTDEGYEATIELGDGQRLAVRKP